MNEKRTEIIDAAAQLIAERGYAHTSVSDVIKRSKLCGKAHFYHYFKSKEELGLEVVSRQFERFAERGLRILREPMIDPVERLNLFVDSVVALQRQRGCAEGSPFGRFAIEMVDAGERFRERVQQVFDRWAAQIEALLWEARPRLADDTDAPRLARFIIATLEGIASDLKRFIAMHLREPARTPATASAATGT